MVVLLGQAQTGVTATATITGYKELDMFCDCPHCQKPIAKGDMHTAEMLKCADGNYHFFHPECASEYARQRQAQYLAHHEERRHRESKKEG